jgi:hypothetical protein
MKYFSLIALILLLSGCSPWNAQLNIFTYNKYILGDESSSTCKVWTATSDEQANRSYGNHNKAIIIQGNFPYKSPITNSSNSVPIDFKIPGI